VLLKQAMVLAAGLGTRLQPFSLIRPKPLFPVLDTPLLLHTINKLRKSDFHSITINAHYLREQFVDLLRKEQGIQLQLENEILGTGGGLRLASKHFEKNTPVLVTNGDIYHTIDLDWVYKQHLLSKQMVTLVLHDYPRFNNVRVNDDFYVQGFDDTTGLKTVKRQRLAFTGIHIINPEIFDLIPPDGFYDIIKCYQNFIRQGGRINGLLAQDHYWTDMGTADDYLQLHSELLQPPAMKSKKPIYKGTHVKIGNNVHLNDWVCIGSGAKIGNNVSLSRVVVWDGARVKDDSNLQDTIVT
jgi:mannose-1-phosphate guanylyltransferase